MRKQFIALALSLFSLCSQAQTSFWNDIDVRVKVGYNIGGTAPVGMPASIRKLNSYTLQPSFVLAVDLTKRLDEHWGVTSGMIFENKSMKEDARVKNYHEQFVRGGEMIEGMYTGDVTTKASQTMITIPVQASYQIGTKWRLRCGPYISYLLSRHFSGEAHDGYLRVGDPTGAKVELGNTPGTKGTYDFSNDMRRWQWGVAAGVDWQTWQRLGFFADLKWGLNGVHNSSFHVIEQTLYPIYATLGLVYKM